jgi:hypothetical protein
MEPRNNEARVSLAAVRPPNRFIGERQPSAAACSFHWHTLSQVTSFINHRSTWEGEEEVPDRYWTDLHRSLQSPGGVLCHVSVGSRREAAGDMAQRLDSLVCRRAKVGVPPAPDSRPLV